MKNYKIVTLIALVSLFFTSCSSDDDNGGLDNQAPVITINEPTLEEVFNVGGEVHLDIDVEDDKELASYKIDIHNNFDGHDHGRSTSAANVEPWSFSQSFDIEAGLTSFNIHDHLEIPQNIAEGEYHLGIFVVDAAGNQSEAFVEIMVGEAHGDDDHEMSITNISVANVVAGETLEAHADLQAEHGIQTVSIEIHGHDLTPTADQIAWEFDQNYTSYTGTTAELHEDISVPANAAPGDYHMTIVMIDEDGNSYAEGVHFEVL